MCDGFFTMTYTEVEMMQICSQLTTRTFLIAKSDAPRWRDSLKSLPSISFTTSIGPRNHSCGLLVAGTWIRSNVHAELADLSQSLRHVMFTLLVL